MHGPTTPRGTGFASQEVGNLGDDGRWHQQFTPGRMQRSEQSTPALSSESYGSAAAASGLVSQTITPNDRIRPSAGPQTGGDIIG